MEVHDSEELISEEGHKYFIRIMSRIKKFAEANMMLRQHFMDLGDGKPVAQTKISELGEEITAATPGAKLDYWIGIKQPLKDQINASNLAHMDAAAKAAIISYL